MKVTEENGVITAKAGPNEDLRGRLDRDGRFICNEDHAWDGDMSSAPKGVRHEVVNYDKLTGFNTCVHCGVTW